MYISAGLTEFSREINVNIIRLHREDLPPLVLNSEKALRADFIPRFSTGFTRDCVLERMPHYLTSHCRKSGRWKAPQALGDLVTALAHNHGRALDC